ncbi:MAG: aldehyde dehydrogenase family protein [Chthoniobacter sp.]|uniref:aldehyde dehydrogenase family protein n=1 Tax=Chthoniobacter sp. TaxID=2510640 RepID=UPI0032A256EE
MVADRWTNLSPGDLSVALPEVVAGDVTATVERAHAAAPAWAHVSLQDRIGSMHAAQQALAAAKDELARGITIETGKPITEAQGEVGAVISKIGFTIADAETHLAERHPADGPQASTVRQRARGPAAVIGPFNFPLHLGHGANVAHLLAGNPVVYKPSPLAANVAARYGELMAPHFPHAVFQVLQGGAHESEALCLEPRVRAVCFTGSVPVGRTLAQKLAGDFSKDLALELGGSNALIVCADADLDKAALAAADGACLTAGQRCNATSRVIVLRPVAAEFVPRFLTALQTYAPGDPLLATTRLGPLISIAAVERYERLCDKMRGSWLVPGRVEPVVAGRRGHYVHPAVIQCTDDGHADAECFVPIVSVFIAEDLDHAVRLQGATPFGLSASIFTRSEATFRRLGAQLEVGNLYANLPTTFSPSTLPFGGWRDSGNGRPGGRGFIRYTTREQAVQFTGFEAP